MVPKFVHQRNHDTLEFGCQLIRVELTSSTVQQVQVGLRSKDITPRAFAEPAIKSNSEQHGEWLLQGGIRPQFWDSEDCICGVADHGGLDDDVGQIVTEV